MPDNIINPFTDIPLAELPIPTEKNAGSVFLSDLRELSVGYGTNVFRMDKQGIWLGAATFDAAPFSVSMLGDVIANSILISGRSGSVLAGAINADGNFVNDVINARFNTSTKKILSDFNFGSVDYAGAVKSGDIAWDENGENITGSGVAVYRKGIVGALNGVVRFSLDAETGDAVFAGTIVGVSGTFGTITAGTIDGCDIFANKFGYKKNTHTLLLGNLDRGWFTSLSPSVSMTYYGTNQLGMYIASNADETTYIQTRVMNILIGGTGTGVMWIFNPTIEFWGAVTIAGTSPYARVRMGSVEVNTDSYVGFDFGVVSGVICPKSTGRNGGGGTILTTVTHDTINAAQWHKYKIEVAKNTSTNFTIRWYIDDVLVRTDTMAEAWSGTPWGFGALIRNNAADIAQTIKLEISHALLQQNYS